MLTRTCAHRCEHADLFSDISLMHQNTGLLTTDRSGRMNHTTSSDMVPDTVLPQFPQGSECRQLGRLTRGTGKGTQP
eukprot:2500110-Rhodomonas_salina.1